MLRLIVSLLKSNLTLITVSSERKTDIPHSRDIGFLRGFNYIAVFEVSLRVISLTRRHEQQFPDTLKGRLERGRVIVVGNAELQTLRFETLAVGGGAGCGDYVGSMDVVYVQEIVKDLGTEATRHACEEDWFVQSCHGAFD